MTISHTYSLNWRHPFCSSCLKNSHAEQKAVLKKIFSPNDENVCEELFVCTKCGSTSRM